MGYLPIAFQEGGEIIPEDPAARVVWVIVGLVILGLYFFMREARKRAAAEYWRRRKEEDERRANDPDMRKD